MASRVCCGWGLAEAWIVASAVRKMRELVRYQASLVQLRFCTPFLGCGRGVLIGGSTCGPRLGRRTRGHLARQVLQAFRFSKSHVGVGRVSETDRA